MNRIKLDKGEVLVSENIDFSNEGFIISIKRDEDDDDFYLHIKISTECGNDVKEIVMPLKRLRRFKGII